MHLIVGLRDGTALAFPLGTQGIDFQTPRVEQLGVHPIQLIEVQHSSNNSETSVIALSDKPWRITNSAVGLVFSPINFGRVDHATSFSFDGGLEGLLLIRNEMLHLVSMDVSSKAMHVETTPLTEVLT